MLLTDRGLARRWHLTWPGATTLASRAAPEASSTPRCHAPGSAATEISYTIYTSGTTGNPKGVQRDVGGYAVALASSMRHIFDGRAGETYFSTSDIGWVVGHSYIVYGPLIAGMATLMYEGLPTQGIDRQPDGGIWWRLVEKYKVTVMFSAPTAVRVLRSRTRRCSRSTTCRACARCSWRAEPLDETDRALDLRRGCLGDADHRQLLADRIGLADRSRSPMAWSQGAASSAARAFRCTATACKILHESTGEELTGANEKGVVVIEGADAAGLHADRVEGRRGASSTPTGTACPARWSIRPSTGAFATRTATSTSWAAPTT